MKKLKNKDYYVQNGHKFFYTKNDMNFQCAYCLYVQEREFVKNKKGLIIGSEIKEENHADNCYQNE